MQNSVLSLIKMLTQGSYPTVGFILVPERRWQVSLGSKAELQKHHMSSTSDGFTSQRRAQSLTAWQGDIEKGAIYWT